MWNTGPPFLSWLDRGAMEPAQQAVVYSAFTNLLWVKLPIYSGTPPQHEGSIGMDWSHPSIRMVLVSLGPYKSFTWWFKKQTMSALEGTQASVVWVIDFAHNTSPVFQTFLEAQAKASQNKVQKGCWDLGVGHWQPVMSIISWDFSDVLDW